MPAFLSAQAKDFISRALCKNAAARPSIAELLAHAWVSSEARRTSSNTERSGVGGFLLQRMFKDGAPSPALKSRVDAAASARLRPQLAAQAASSPKAATRCVRPHPTAVARP